MGISTRNRDRGAGSFDDHGRAGGIRPGAARPPGGSTFFALQRAPGRC